MFLECDTEPQFPWGLASAVEKSPNSLLFKTSFALRKNDASIGMVEANAVQDALRLGLRFSNNSVCTVCFFTSPQEFTTPLTSK